MAGSMVPHDMAESTQCAFFFAPAVQYVSYGAVLTLETLGQRWGWEKTKVRRFFQKHRDSFALYRLPGAYGCLVFNKLYPTDTEVSLPDQAEIELIIEQMRMQAGKMRITGTDNIRMNKIVFWYSLSISLQPCDHEKATPAESRVAVSDHIIRAYLSLCWNCENCVYDCRGVYDQEQSENTNHILES